MRAPGKTFLFRNSSNGTFADWTDAHPAMYECLLTSWLSVMLVITVCGTVSNTVLLIIIGRSKRLRSGTGFLIFHLLATGLLMCGIHYPIHIVLVYGSNYWFTLPANICSYVYYLLIVTKYANNWFEAWLGVNRFVAAVCPLFYSNLTTPKFAVFIVAFSWLFSALTVLPYCMNYLGVFTVSLLGQCVMRSTSVTGIALQSFNSYAPYAVVCFATVAIVGKTLLRKWHARVPQAAPVIPAPVGLRWRKPILQRLLFHRRTNPARMLFLSFVFCVLCNLPTSVMTSISFSAAFSSYVPLLRIYLHVCLLSQYAFTPVSSSTGCHIHFLGTHVHDI